MDISLYSDYLCMDKNSIIIFFVLIKTLTVIYVALPDTTFSTQVALGSSKKPDKNFCGWETYGKCDLDADCIRGGCSGQVCQSKNEEPVITTCEWKECYDLNLFQLKCRCINKQCKWQRND